MKRCPKTTLLLTGGEQPGTAAAAAQTPQRQHMAPVLPPQPEHIGAMLLHHLKERAA